VAKHSLGITFGDAGIGATINQYDLQVPLNQRSYAWERAHVRTLFEDYSGAIHSDSPAYFLGTIVLTQASHGHLEVADGQQRLATTTILIAAIRDYLYSNTGTEKNAAIKYTQQYLLEFDEHTGENAPKLRLNSDDNDFFVKNILLSPDDAARGSAAVTSPSHEKLAAAAAEAKAHVEKLVAPYAKAEGAKRLYEWIQFLRDGAVVIVIRVPDHINAYTLFETLNDRGLRASQADILKNFLFGKSQDRLGEVSLKWSAMSGTIEAIGQDDLLLTFLRHYWISQNGPTTEKELARKFRDTINGRQQAVDTSIALEKTSIDYAGLFTPLENMSWTSLDKQTRGYIYVITRVLGIEQIRPLLLSVVWKFSPVEAKKAFRLFVSWSVRFLIAGGGGGGVLDRHYGLRAKEVTEGSVTTAKELAAKMVNVVRNDVDFRTAMLTHRVSKSPLARYYLRALELKMQGEPNPELGGVLEDTVLFNLEHVMPLIPGDGWELDPEILQANNKRLGNMALLNPEANVGGGNKSFKEKLPIYKSSPLLLTQEIANNTTWGPEQIAARQEIMADLAPMVWSL
jgi:hypothetical protein